MLVTYGVCAGILWGIRKVIKAGSNALCLPLVVQMEVV